MDQMITPLDLSVIRDDRSLGLTLDWLIDLLHQIASNDAMLSLLTKLLIGAAAANYLRREILEFYWAAYSNSIKCWLIISIT